MKLNFKAGKAHVDQEAASQKPVDQRIGGRCEPTNLKVWKVFSAKYPLVCLRVRPSSGLYRQGWGRY